MDPANQREDERCAACDKELADSAPFTACRRCLARHHPGCWPEGARCSRCAGAEAFRAGAPQRDDPDALPEPPPGSIIAVSRRRGAIEYRWREPSEGGRSSGIFAAFGALAALVTVISLRDGFSPGDPAILAVTWLLAMVMAFVTALMQPAQERVSLRIGPPGLSLGRGAWWRPRKSLAWHEIGEVFLQADREGGGLILVSRGRNFSVAGGRDGSSLTRKDRRWLLSEIHRQRR